MNAIAIIKDVCHGLPKATQLQQKIVLESNPACRYTEPRQDGIEHDSASWPETVTNKWS